MKCFNLNYIAGVSGGGGGVIGGSIGGLAPPDLPDPFLLVIKYQTKAPIIIMAATIKKSVILN